MNGIARNVRITSEGQKAVLRFRIETSEPERKVIPVEMRGTEIRGDIHEGDEIQVDASREEPGDATVRPVQIYNMTTFAVVQAWSPPFFRAIPMQIGQRAIDFLVTTFLGAFIGYIGFQLKGSRSEGAPVPSSTVYVPPSTSPNTTLPDGTTTTTIYPYPAPPAPHYWRLLLPVAVLAPIFFFLPLRSYIVWRIRKYRQMGKTPIHLVATLGLGLFVGLLLIALILTFA